MPKKLGNRVAGTIISVALFFTISPGVLAAEFHEDPETAEVIFSGISLLRYYSAALDLVLQKNPAEVEARLQKLPLANIPPELAAVTASFAASSIGLSRRVVRIEQYQAQFRALLAQSRLDEAIQLADEILAQLSQANNELDKIEAATVVTGRELEVFSAPRLSD
ncbi:MAG: hypothetical protein Q8Q07_04335, partial [Dehalococcoidales bacterium]|nr:hypothetical protein [Dehalococcoidales bacterium]